MQDSDDAILWNCPFLKPVMADWIWMYPTGVYCRLTSGRIRIPSRDSVARFCTSSHYYDCPGYRSWRQEETAVT